MSSPGKEELLSTYQQLEAKLATVEQVTENHKNLLSGVKILEQQQKYLKEEIQEITKELSTYQKTKNPSEKLVSKIEARIKKLKDDQKRATEGISQLCQRFEYVCQGFSPKEKQVLADIQTTFGEKSFYNQSMFALIEVDPSDQNRTEIFSEYPITTSKIFKEEYLKSIFNF